MCAYRVCMNDDPYRGFGLLKLQNASVVRIERIGSFTVIWIRYIECPKPEPQTNFINTIDNSYTKSTHWIPRIRASRTSIASEVRQLYEFDTLIA